MSDLFADVEARMRDAQFCLAPLRPFAGMRDYDEVLRRIIELLTPAAPVKPTESAPDD